MGLVELLALKVLELISSNESENIVIHDDKTNSTCEGDQKKQERLTHWSKMFLQTVRKLHRMEKVRHQEPKFVSMLKPLAKFLHRREQGRRSLEHSESGSVESRSGTLSFLDTKSYRSTTRSGIYNVGANSPSSTIQYTFDKKNFEAIQESIVEGQD